jgi:hypothetical protein
MIREKNMRDILRVLETFDEQKPREYMSKQKLEQLFKEQFDEANLKRMVRHLADKKYIECIEYADFIDYRIRITEMGRKFLQGDDAVKTVKEPFSKKLLWVLVGVAICGIAYCIIVRFIP